MEKYLEKQLYVYRKSYLFFHKIGFGLSLGKLIFCASGFSAFALPPMAVLTLGAALIEGLDKQLKISSRTHEYKLVYTFYKHLLNLYKANEINEHDIKISEDKFLVNLNFFPREKYMKQMGLNGYGKDETSNSYTYHKGNSLETEL